jgi:hypothetical protein
MDRPTTTMAGKPVYVYDPGPPRKVADLRELVRRRSTFFTLASLGETCAQLWTTGRPGGMLDGVYAPLHAFPYLALLAIEASNDHRRGTLTTKSELKKLLQTYNALEEPDLGRFAEDNQAALSFVLRSGGRLEFQRELRHALPRIVLLLRDIWPRVEKAKAISPTLDLQRLTGLDLDRLLFFGWVFAGKGQAGVFEPYPESDALPMLPLFSREGQENFLRWASADYQTIRAMGAEARAGLPNESFDPYRFNPFTVYPLVRPEARKGSYCLPCQLLLFDRVHRGLYHVLADHHRGAQAKVNPFRSAFGFVFQEYIGELLRTALGARRVQAERRYLAGKEEVDSVDWIVVEGDVGVLIEVKQSALSLPAKSIGDMAAAEADLKKTVVKAVRQLGRTEAAIRQRRPGMEDLGGVRDFERLIVTYDTIHFGNSFMRELVAGELGPDAPHAHLCGVEEFEYLLARSSGEGLHAILRRKRLDPNGNTFDLKDWLGYQNIEEGVQPENTLLTAKYREIIASWNVRRSLSLEAAASAGRGNAGEPRRPCKMLDRY